MCRAEGTQFNSKCKIYQQFGVNLHFDKILIFLYNINMASRSPHPDDSDTDMSRGSNSIDPATGGTTSPKKPKESVSSEESDVTEVTTERHSRRGFFAKVIGGVAGGATVLAAGGYAANKGVEVIENDPLLKEIMGKNIYEIAMRPALVHGLLRLVRTFCIQQRKEILKKKKGLTPEEEARLNSLRDLIEMETVNKAMMRPRPNATEEDQAQYVSKVERLARFEAEVTTLKKKASSDPDFPKYLQREKDYMPYFAWVAEAFLLVSDFLCWWLNHSGSGGGTLFAVERAIEHVLALRMSPTEPEGDPSIVRVTRRTMLGTLFGVAAVGGSAYVLTNLPALKSYLTSPSTGSDTPAPAPAPSPAAKPDIGSKPPVAAPMTPEQEQKLLDAFRRGS